MREISEDNPHVPFPFPAGFGESSLGEEEPSAPDNDDDAVGEASPTASKPEGVITASRDESDDSSLDEELIVSAPRRRGRPPLPRDAEGNVIHTSDRPNGIYDAQVADLWNARPKGETLRAFSFRIGIKMSRAARAIRAAGIKLPGRQPKFIEKDADLDAAMTVSTDDVDDSSHVDEPSVTKPKRRAGRPPLPRDEHGNVIRRAKLGPKPRAAAAARNSRAKDSTPNTSIAPSTWATASTSTVNAFDVAIDMVGRYGLTPAQLRELVGSLSKMVG